MFVVSLPGRHPPVNRRPPFPPPAVRGSSDPVRGSRAASRRPLRRAEPLKIGVLAPLSGPFAANGASFVQAATLAVEQANAEGGALGRRIEIVVSDTEGRVDVARTETLRLISREGVNALVGAYLSEETMGVMETAGAHKTAAHRPRRRHGRDHRPHPPGARRSTGTCSASPTPSRNGPRRWRPSSRRGEPPATRSSARGSAGTGSSGTRPREGGRPHGDRRFVRRLLQPGEPRVRPGGRRRLRKRRRHRRPGGPGKELPVLPEAAPGAFARDAGPFRRRDARGRPAPAVPPAHRPALCPGGRMEGIDPVGDGVRRPVREAVRVGPRGVQRHPSVRRRDGPRGGLAPGGKRGMDRGRRRAGERDVPGGRRQLPVRRFPPGDLGHRARRAARNDHPLGTGRRHRSSSRRADGTPPCRPSPS